MHKKLSVVLFAVFALSTTSPAFSQEDPGFFPGGPTVHPKEEARTYTLEELEFVRNYLLEILTGELAGIDQTLGRIRTKTVGISDLHDRSLGLGLETRETAVIGIPDPDGFVPIVPARHTFVTAVFPYASASRAGVKPGDRLLKIGKEELDFETGKGVLLQLDNYGSTVPMTFLRGNEQYTATLTHEPVPCFRDVLLTFSPASWEQKFLRHKNVLEELYSGIKKAKLEALEMGTYARGVEIYRPIITQDVTVMEQELDPTTHPACSVPR